MDKLEEYNLKDDIRDISGIQVPRNDMPIKINQNCLNH